MPSRRDPSPPPPSALTSHITTSTPPKTPTSSDPHFTTTTPTPLTHGPHLHHLALQVQHNLTWEHNWRGLQIHTHTPTPTPTPHHLPRPLISGIPPRRIYTHPDLQTELLRRGLREEALEPERAWVVPTRLMERWSLGMWAGVFEGVPEREGVDLEGEGGGEGGKGGVGWKEVGEDGHGDGDGQREKEEEEKKKKPVWDQVKRVLLATVHDDSTVVYYVVHDGVVKPRQN